MLNQRIAVSRAVTTGLVGLEKQIDDAVVMQARLMIELIEGRRAAHLPLTAGQSGLDKVTEVAAHLVAARRLMNEAHYSFREVRDELRLPIHAYGDTGDTPDDGAHRGRAGAAPLALVDAA